MPLLNWIARIRHRARLALMIRSEREYYQLCQQRPRLNLARNREQRVLSLGTTGITEPHRFA